VTETFNFLAYKKDKARKEKIEMDKIKKSYNLK